MKCFVEVIRIEKESAVVAIDETTWDLPLTILPEHSRPGDVLQLQISFSPFQTLAHQMK